MPCFLGIDTSNYTTSAAIFDSNSLSVVHKKQILDVSDGALGLRQSDAVFSHIKNFPNIINSLFLENHDLKITAVGVSSQPRDVKGSYMPCFLAGVMAAESASAVLNCALYKFSHQAGHIVSALYSAGKLKLLKQPFIAFHISGGTTECLLVTPNFDKIIDVKLIASTLDLNAGQVIDRVGVKLGLKFPCGAALDLLSQQSLLEFKINPSLKGFDCCLSGVENKCQNMIDDNEKKEDIAKFCIEYILKTITKMTKKVIEEYGNLPIVFAGGVMSNSIIKKQMSEKFGAFFAEPQFSSDNAAGISILTALKAGEQIG